MNDRRRSGLLLALATAVISGVAVFLNSYGLKAVGDATTYTTLKNAAALLCLIGVVAALRSRAGTAGGALSRPTTRGQWWGLVAVGVIGGAVAFVLFFEGLARASSSNAAFLHKTLLLWVAVLALPLLGERLTRWHVLAILALLVGQIGLAGGASAAAGVGQLMVLAATLLWAVEVVLAKWLLADVSSWTIALARMGIGSAVLIFWTAVSGRLGAVLTFTAAQWGWVLLTGVLLAGYVSTWFAALARAQAIDVTAVLVFGAIITATLAAWVSGTSLASQVGWLALVLVGTAAVLVPSGARREQVPT
jgi:drug/metabolite transporter (DMT)-like permease